MGQTIDVSSLEARKVRIMLALRLLSGEDIPVLDDEERALLDEFRELRNYGFGRMEVVMVDSQIDGLNVTRHKKRRDLIKTSRNT